MRTHGSTEALPASECAERLAEACEHVSRFAEAAAAWREAADAERGGAEPDAFRLAHCLGALGHALSRAGQDEEAREAFRESLHVNARAFQTLEPGETLSYGHFYQASLRYWRLAEVCERLGRDSEAEDAYLAALRVKHIYSSDEDREVGHLHEGLADLYLRAGHAAAAETHLQRAVEVYRTACAGEDEWLAVVARKRGDAALGREDHGAAAAHYVEAERILTGPGAPDVEWHERLLLLVGLGRAAAAGGDEVEARRRFAAALELAQSESAARDPSVGRQIARGLCTVGDVLRDLGERPRAWDAWAVALEHATSSPEKSDELVEEIRSRLRPAGGA